MSSTSVGSTRRGHRMPVLLRVSPVCRSCQHRCCPPPSQTFSYYVMSLNGILMPRARGKCRAILLGSPTGNCPKGLGLLHRTHAIFLGGVSARCCPRKGGGASAEHLPIPLGRTSRARHPRRAGHPGIHAVLIVDAFRGILTARRNLLVCAQKPYLAKKR